MRFTQALRVRFQKIPAGEDADHPVVITCYHNEAANVGFHHVIGGLAQSVVFANDDGRATQQ